MILRFIFFGLSTLLFSSTWSGANTCFKDTVLLPCSTPVSQYNSSGNNLFSVYRYYTLHRLKEKNCNSKSLYSDFGRLRQIKVWSIYGWSRQEARTGRNGHWCEPWALWRHQGQSHFMKAVLMFQLPNPVQDATCYTDVNLNVYCHGLAIHWLSPL